MICAVCSGANADKEPEAEELVIFMDESLWVSPEDFEEDVLEEALHEVNNPEVIYVASDIPADCVLEEDDAVAIFAKLRTSPTLLTQKEARSRISQGERSQQRTQFEKSPWKPRTTSKKVRQRPESTLRTSKEVQEGTSSHKSSEEMVDDEAQISQQMCSMRPGWTLGTRVHQST